MVRLRRVTFLFIACGFVAALAACSDNGAIRERCGALEADGCPGETLASCADLACAFVARCDVASGAWTRVATCPARPVDAGTVEAASDAAIADAVAPGAEDAGSSSAGCPPLEVPDCSESTRAACPSGCCGCEDVFRCVAGGWDYVGACNP